MYRRPFRPGHSGQTKPVIVLCLFHFYSFPFLHTLNDLVQNEYSQSKRCVSLSVNRNADVVSDTTGEDAITVICYYRSMHHLTEGEEVGLTLQCGFNNEPNLIRIFEMQIGHFTGLVSVLCDVCMLCDVIKDVDFSGCKPRINESLINGVK